MFSNKHIIIMIMLVHGHKQASSKRFVLQVTTYKLTSKLI